jgi:serine/threonine protein kinase/WD40 repeat protein
MPSTNPVPSAERNPFEVLAEEFVERQRRGENPSLTEYTEKHPELAEEIRDLFPALVMVERLKPGGDVLAEGVTGQPTRPTAQDVEPAGRLGDYRLVREVARGGMGVVYEAVQESLGRHVALKVLSGSSRLSPAQIERFQLEARSAGRLHHPNIVPVHGVGEHQGVYYYAMQFIPGHGLDAILDDLRRLRGLTEGAEVDSRGGRIAINSADRTDTAALACSLLTGRFPNTGASASEPLAVAPTIAESHPGGELLGDLTANPLAPLAQPLPTSAEGESLETAMIAASTDTSALSLRTESEFFRSVARIGTQVADALSYAHQQGILHRDIKPSNLLLDVTGKIWVTDFGLAKLEGSSGPTRTGDIVGTVRYMAPERFDGWSDRRSDVYSLGATLYELLTLRPLFASAHQAELIEKVLHAAPEWPRKLDPKIPRDLETIVLKAIAKEPADRYASAEVLRDDLQRFLDDRPIRARRSTPVEQFWRWCRRNPLPAAALTTAAAAVVALAVGSAAMAWKFRDQRDQVRLAQTQTRENLLNALTAQARATRVSRRQGQRVDSLKALAQAAALARDLKLPPLELDRLRDEAVACLALPDLEPSGRAIPRPPSLRKFAFDSTMTRFAQRFRDGRIVVRRVADDQQVSQFHAAGDRDIGVLRLSPDGRYLAATHDPDFALTVWDIDRRRRVVEDPGPLAPGAARFSPDSRRIASVHKDGQLLLYDLATGQISRQWRLPAPGDLAFRPDGIQLAVSPTVPKNPTCQIFDVKSGQLVDSIPLPLAGTLAWSPDDATLAIACDDCKIHLWDIATHTRRATLVGHSHFGLRSDFHPDAVILASNGWEGRLWLWDAVLGRPWLNVRSAFWPEFSHDGRVIIAVDDALIPYQVFTAREYRTFSHVSTQPIRYTDASIRADSRLMALGTTEGAVLWDLARGTELGVLPIGSASHIRMEASGDLLTSSPIGVWRWPIRLDVNEGEFGLGPPQQLRLPPGHCGISMDRSGRIAALADFTFAHVVDRERYFDVGPLDECRAVAVSPDGEWLATGSHGRSGAQVWRLRDGALIADLPIEGLVAVDFSPDGKWLLTSPVPCRLWEVGTWREGMRLGGFGLAFSPDGRMVVVQDTNNVLRLVESATGRNLVRLESPDLHVVGQAAFSSDGSRLAVSTNDGPAVHIWDLRAIRERLAELGLDWDAPAYSNDDSASESVRSLPPLRIDYGPLAGHLQWFSESPQVLIDRFSARLKTDPGDAETYHQRGHVLVHVNRLKEGIADLTRAIALHRDDAHLLAARGEALNSLQERDAAIEDLSRSLARRPDQLVVRDSLAMWCNNRAWALATVPKLGRDLTRALQLARRAVELNPDQSIFLNTLGVVLYRAGEFREAIATLESSLQASRGRFDGFDLFFLAMAHHRLGHRGPARACFDRGASWLQGQTRLTEQYLKELTEFRAEAEAVLAGTHGELPENVFAVRP